MEAKELKIGNYVYWNVPPKPEYDELIDSPMRVVSIEHIENFDDMGFKMPNEDYLIELYSSKKDKSYYTSIERIKPIPLTEEILLKCGFERYTYKKIIIDKNVYLFKYINIIIGCCLTSAKYFYLQEHLGNENTYIGAYKEMQYLHQLQNLIYILAGKELEFNF